MTPTTEFEFARDWVHACIRYEAGDVAKLPAAEAEKLTRLGAGSVVEPERPKRRELKRK